MGHPRGHFSDDFQLLGLFQLLGQADALRLGPPAFLNFDGQFPIAARQVGRPVIDPLFELTVGRPDVFLFQGQLLPEKKIPPGGALDSVARHHADDVGADEEKVVADHHGERCYAESDVTDFV